MKTFTTSGTGSQQTLSELETDKVPLYNSLADAEADLANLEEGQIVATKDTGDELAQPVDVVEEDNLHAVTSNAVAELFKKYSYTKQSDSSTIAGNGYTEIEIPQNLLPTSVQGYTLVGNQIGQTNYRDAFLFNLHININNNWSITVSNCASVAQTVPDILVTLLFMRNI